MSVKKCWRLKFYLLHCTDSPFEGKLLTRQRVFDQGTTIQNDLHLDEQFRALEYVKMM